MLLMIWLLMDQCCISLKLSDRKACRSLIVERCTPSKKEFGLSFNGGSPGPYPVLELLGIKSLP